jgi:hypothetical protein
MSFSVHDLRVSLRDKIKKIDELETQVCDLKNQIKQKDNRILEYEQNYKKKDDVIAIKEVVIKEKDSRILKLETELIELNEKLNDYISSNNKPFINGNTSNKISNNYATVNEINQKLANSEIDDTVPNKLKNFPQNSTNAAAAASAATSGSSSVGYNKLKRVAISAESVPNRTTKTKDQTIIKKYAKSEQ